jgi:DNA-binding transcriptional MerR regulator
MPTLDDYAPFAPFTLDELVTAANRILAGAATEEIRERTVRYYISERLLPPPISGGKHARYGLEHLRRLVAIRTWLGEGVGLAEAKARLGVGPEPVILGMVAPQLRDQATVVRKIRLTDRSTLEIAGDRIQADDIDQAIEALKDLRRTFRDSP